LRELLSKIGIKNDTPEKIKQETLNDKGYISRIAPNFVVPTGYHKAITKDYFYT